MDVQTNKKCAFLYTRNSCGTPICTQSERAQTLNRGFISFRCIYFIDSVDYLIAYCILYPRSSANTTQHKRIDRIEGNNGFWFNLLFDTRIL